MSYVAARERGSRCSRYALRNHYTTVSVLYKRKSTCYTCNMYFCVYVGELRFQRITNSLLRPSSQSTSLREIRIIDQSKGNSYHRAE